MRFYSGGALDKQGRLNLSGYIDLAGRSVMIYTTEEDFSLLYVLPYDGQVNVPKCAIHKVDKKGRIIVPSSLRRGAKYAYISNDVKAGVVVKLVWWDEDEPG